MAYTKLFNSIITSTIWTEDDKTRIVWITMLAIADKNGEVQGSIPGLARLAGVSVEAAEMAITKFLSPDKHSRTKDDEGRRIEEIDGGWALLNHAKYREMASREEAKEANAERQRRFKERRKRNANNGDGNGPVTLPLHIAEAEAEAEAEAVPPNGGVGGGGGITEGKNSKNIPTTEQSKRIAKIFHRRESTPWQANEVRAYKKLGTIPEEDLAAVEGYYAANWPPCRDKNILRHDLLTFLNNFQGEVGRAYAAKEPKRDTRRAREIETVHTADTLPRL